MYSQTSEMARRVVAEEPYLSARVLSAVFQALEMGDLVNVYADLRRVDNVIDEDTCLDNSQKQFFLQSEWQRIQSSHDGARDDIYTNRFWNLAPKELVLKHFKCIFGALEQDTKMNHWEARNHGQNLTDLRGGFLSPIQLTSLFLTKNEVDLNSRLRTWIYHAYVLGNMGDLQEDFSRGQLKMPLTFAETKKVNFLQKPEQRSAEFRNIFTKKRFQFTKWKAIGKLMGNCGAWADSGLPRHLISGIFLYHFQLLPKVMLLYRYPWKS